jgi:hypothetical protein
MKKEKPFAPRRIMRRQWGERLAGRPRKEPMAACPKWGSTSSLPNPQAR